MNKTTITVGGVTYAIKLRKLFARAGIESELVKVAGKEGLGCTHGVRVKDEEFYRAVVIMRENGIEYSIFRDN